MASPTARRPGRPRGESRVQTKIRLPTELHQAVIRRATEERRSLTATVERALLDYLDRRPTP